MQELGTEIAVTGPDAVDDGGVVTMPLPADLAAGAYTVDWRATSGDGHPISGSFAFTVESGPEAAPAAPEESAPAEDRTVEEAAVTEPAGSSVGWTVGGAAVLVLVGAGLAVWQLRRRA